MKTLSLLAGLLLLPILSFAQPATVPRAGGASLSQITNIVRSILISSNYGSGSGFPLTATVSAEQFGITNLQRINFGNGGTISNDGFGELFLYPTNYPYAPISFEYGGGSARIFVPGAVDIGYNLQNISQTAALMVSNSVYTYAATFRGGNVGIGTNAPVASLHVGNGGIAQIDGNQLRGGDGKKLLQYNPTLNTHFAFGAGNTNVTGARNLGIGMDALNSISSGTDNIAIGKEVGYSINTGVGNVLLGTFVGEFLQNGARNTGIGYGTLNAIRSVSASTAVGGFAGNALTNGDYNTLIGHGAGKPLINGRYNTIVGGDALRDGTFVNETVAVGVDSFMKSTNGYNTGLGTYSFQFLYDGTKNVGVGWNAGTGFLGGSSNVIIGADNTTITNGIGNIIIGDGADGALPANTTSTLSIGNLIFGTGLSSGATISSGKGGIGTIAPSAKWDVTAATATPTFATHQTNNPLGFATTGYTNTTQGNVFVALAGTALVVTKFETNGTQLMAYSAQTGAMNVPLKPFQFITTTGTLTTNNVEAW